MKFIRRHTALFGGLVCLGAAVLGITLSAHGQSLPAPVITIAPTGTNHYLITVTNGVSYGNYTLYTRSVLGNPGYPWTFVTNPVPGVTNFTVSQGPDIYAFFEVTGGTNWNSGGIPNWNLADPKNPSLGALTVTIVSPAQGQIIQ